MSIVRAHPTSRPLRIAAALTLALASVDARPAAAWRQEFAGTKEGGADYAHAQALDAAGNVIAAGALDNGEDGIVFTVAKLAAASGAVLWKREIEGSASTLQGALSVAVDANGDVVAAGELDLDFTVLKLSGVDGSEVWRTQVDGSHTFETVEEARAVAVDASNDVFATGFIGNAATGRDILVLKLASGDGGEMWRAEIDGGDGLADRASVLALDGSGNPVIAGRLASNAAKDDFAVIKLDGASGGESWRRRIDGSDSNDDEALALAIAPSGDVVAAGALRNAVTAEDFAVVRLAAASGAELWRTEIDGGLGGSVTDEQANGVTIDSAGDVIAVGALEYVNRALDWTVVKLAGATGGEIWRREIEGEMVAANDIAYSVDTDAANHVIAAGRIENGPRPSFDFTVMKLDAATGAEIWRQMVDGSNTLGPRLEEVGSVLVDASGDVVAAGFLDNDDEYRDFTVMKFDGEAGIVGSARGTRMRLLDYAGKPEKRMFSADIFDAVTWTPPPGSAHDPTVAGAEIRIINPLTLEEAVFVLPPGPNWRASGSPPGSAGYVYSDDGTNGPCTLFQARPRNRLKMSCSGKVGDIPFTLDETTQGAIGVTVRFGSSERQCAVFGGKVRRDVGISNPGPHGVFQAVQARSFLGAACP